MNKEEKKAIEELKEEISRPVEVPEDKFDTFILYNIENAKIILNLISKLQKENEELKDYHDRTKHTIKIAKMHRKKNEILKKVIDLMALHIASSAIVDDTVCMHMDCINEECHSEYAIECTKKYFYKQLEVEDE